MKRLVRQRADIEVRLALQADEIAKHNAAQFRSREKFGPLETEAGYLLELSEQTRKLCDET